MPVPVLLPAVPSASARPAGREGPLLTGFLPKEHGSWSLVLEPLLLGLLVAPSLAGGALATTGFAGFLARRPLKAALAPECTPARRAARRTVVLFVILMAAGFSEVLAAGGWIPLWPLALAVPWGLLFAWLDARGDSRAAAAELAGSIAFALLPAALATLAGWTPAPALALAGLALIRSVPTILVVRTYLRIKKGGTASRLTPLAAGLAALLLSLLLTGRHLVPVMTVGLGAFLCLRGGWLLSPWRPAWTGRQVGQTETVIGAGYVTLLALGY